MVNRELILKQIKQSVMATDPGASVILYGSYARGDYNEESDIDLLILVDQEKVTRADKIRIAYPLYDLQFANSILISPMIVSRRFWQSEHRVTPFFENVNAEGIILSD